MLFRPTASTLTPEIDELILQRPPLRICSLGGAILQVSAREEEGSMGITRLNHAVLYVRDLERSVAFYSEVLGFDEST